MSNINEITVPRKDMLRILDTIQNARIHYRIEVKDAIEKWGVDDILTRHKWQVYKHYVEQEDKVKCLLYPWMNH